jgi:hypothetical protein
MRKAAACGVREYRAGVIGIAIFLVSLLLLSPLAAGRHCGT